MSKVTKVIIPVGGFGTRFLPATKAQPKEMLPVVDKPVIQYLVEEAVESGIERVVLVTGKGKRAIEDHFDHASELESYLESRGKNEVAKEVRKIAAMASFSYVRQKEPKGIGDAILQAQPLIMDKEVVAVMSGDDIIDSKVPALKQLINVYNKYKAPVMSLRKVPLKDVHKYGVIKGKQVSSGVWKISGVVEKPRAENAPSDLMVISKYVLTPEVFKFLAKTKPAPNGEVYLTVAVDEYIKSGGKMYGCEVEGEYYDCGDKLGYMKAMVNYGIKHTEIGKDFKEYLKGFEV